MEDGIPSDAEIEYAVRDIIRMRRRVESQRELYELVVKQLSSEGMGARTTPSRVRRIAVSSGAAGIEIGYRDSTAAGLPEICPVCKGGMTPVRSINLDGELVELRRNCSVCTYFASGKAKIPSRYAFVKPPMAVSDTAERIRKLKKAAAHLRIAKRLIAEAVEGTSIHKRAEFSSELIDEITSSKQEPGSIRNLEADLKEDEGPLWTRPLDSPKKAHGKDI